VNGGWKGSTRKSRLPPNWPQIRLRIGERDRWRCQWRLPSGFICGKHANQIDHKIPGDDHSDENLQCLCEEHHTLKSSSEGARAKWARIKATKARVERPPEQVPVIKPKEPPRYAGF
jgi:5-methylcytosine-specific restriction protein A